MRWGLRRDPRGRHALGAAVTALPTAPPRPDQVPVLADQAWSERFPDAQSDTQPVAVVVPAEPAPAEPPSPQSVSVTDAPPAASGPAPAGPVPAPRVAPAPAAVPPVVHDVLLQLPSQPVDQEPFGTAAPPLQAPAPQPPVVTAAPMPPPVPPVETLLQIPAARPSPVAAPVRAPEPAVPELLDGFAALAAFRPPAQAVPPPHAPAHPAAPAPVPAAPPLAPAAPAPPGAVPAAPAVPAGPRVEIGFADGTFRMLDPSSSAAQALSDLVAELTSKDTGSGATAS